MKSITYLLIRLTIGASMLGHGIVRMPKMQEFSNWMMTTFENSLLPEFLVKPFSYGLPIIELTLGFTLCLGIKTKESSIIGAMTMIILIFGSCLIEKWDVLSSQMIHGLFFIILIQFIESNKISIDNKIKG